MAAVNRPTDDELPPEINSMAIAGIRVDPDIFRMRVGETLAKLQASDHEEDKRRLKDLLSYSKTIQRQADTVRRVRADWKKHSCGRFYASSPAIQTVTSKFGMRDAFLPDEGMVFIDMDWRSCHVVLAAGLSKDPRMVEDLRAGLIYEQAARFFCPELSGADAERAAKPCVLSALNGAGSGHRGISSILEDFGITLHPDDGVTRKIQWEHNYPRFAASRLTTTRPWLEVESRMLVEALRRTTQYQAVLALHDGVLYQVPERDAEIARAELIQVWAQVVRDEIQVDLEDKDLVKGRILPSWSGAQPPRPAAPILVVDGERLLVREGSKFVRVTKHTLPIELERIHGVSCRVQTAKSDRYMTTTEIFERYGVSVSRLVYSCAATQVVWDAPQRTLTFPTGQVAPGAVRRSSLVEGWLEALCGPRTPKVLDWLASVTRLDMPCAGLVLRGPGGVGKGMLQSALARLMGGYTDYNDAVGKYNGDILHNQLIVLDERAKKDGESEAFRSLVGNDVHRATDKGQMAKELRGFLRLIVFTNSSDPLRLGNDVLEAADDDAIGQRLIVVEVSGDAKAHLGIKKTAGWCDHDGELVCHLRWLIENRRVETQDGARFLVSGDAAEYARKIGSRTGVSGLVGAAYTTWVGMTPSERDRLVRDKTTPFYQLRGPRAGTHVLVNQPGLMRCWSALVGGHPPDAVRVQSALQTLSRSDSSVVSKVTDGRKAVARGYPVPTELLLSPDQDDVDTELDDSTTW